MGGRISGESPREEKLAFRHCGISAERPNQGNDDRLSGTPAIAGLTSRQQLTVCDPLGQHRLWEESD